MSFIDKDKAKHEIHYLEVDGEIDDRSIPLDKTFIQSEEKYFEDMSLEDYKEKVGEILEDINNGRLMQCVLSRIEGHRLQRHPFESYQKLRDANPSPYSFFYDIGDGTALYGASPEINIGINDRLIEIRPIAGTVKRSDNPVEDLRLKQQLLSDPKERAEHTMLIDLARNDINRICHAQSVHEPDTMIVEEYPNLYHMVSSVRGVLKNEFNAIDALVTTLPQGTLSGSPKREAMIALENLEESRRGYYGGAVGYINFNGYCNTGIVIRSVYVEKGMSFVRSGAGIVADSLPENEANEIQLKAEKATVVLRGE